MSFRTLFATLVALVFFAFPVAASAQVKVAYVDVQRVLLEVEEGKAAKARLEKWLNDRQAEIHREQQALMKEKEALDKQASSMKEDQRMARAAALQQKVMDLAQKWERSRAEAADKERKEMEPIMAKVSDAVESIAKAQGIAMVFEKRASSVMYAQAQLDLTNEVIRQYGPKKK